MKRVNCVGSALLPYWKGSVKWFSFSLYMQILGVIRPNYQGFTHWFLMCYIHMHQLCNSSQLPESGHNCGTFLRSENNGSNAVCFRRVVGFGFNEIFGLNWPSNLRDFSWPWSPSFLWPMWSYVTAFSSWSLMSNNQPSEWRPPSWGDSLSGQPWSHMGGRRVQVAGSLHRESEGALEPTRWHRMVMLSSRTRLWCEKCWKMV